MGLALLTAALAPIYGVLKILIFVAKAKKAQVKV